MQQAYKRPKKATVQLTSLLDLLFVMIFVSLIQQKNIPQKAKTKKPAPVAKAAPKPKVKPKPTPAPPPVVPKQFGVSATFHFYATADNPGLPTGTYLMQGSYDQKTGKLQLGGVSWIKRPANYDMVPLSGIIENDGNIFRGRIEFIGCKQFTLQRVKKNDSTPISGEWQGMYDCSQGMTGLTLTIGSN